MAFNQNQLLDFHIHLRRAAINQKLIGGDTLLLDIAEKLLLEAEIYSEDHKGETAQMEEEANELQAEIDELTTELSKAAALISSLNGNDYRHIQDGNRLSDTYNFSALERLLLEYEQ
ncbi:MULTISPECIES: hypothetical protein [Haematospirillum]|uniref:hypothetical protein n=1 Tax=Haematospirillum TaxID=1804663 RepID=UPI0014331F64|nr:MULTISPECIES: hypothetical protein [Haematospirillum]NKD46261.1 hypothetical protein [Haematospirillum jordaniae]NKD56052.1 hypothetical protein [Haematospirillum sp. H4890]NKD76112.1 hypothetical protein [Haematospirillum sp. H4485]NKD82345.1 hypothetical protein [Haematospirillum jordaniae]NKD84484.1 hypothetical protein [Haematospirillum jordaniae]